MRTLFYVLIIQIVVVTPKINLYFTDLTSDNTVQHDCLRVSACVDEVNINRQVISYCITESLSKYNIQNNDQFSIFFTFDELAKQNITSQQLYQWSAPIDAIEDYQLYLNELSSANDSSLASKVYYNCTLPRFGSMCQYEFNFYDPNYSSLHEFIHDFYSSPYNPTNMTCYIHLECYRGPSPSCLDWSEICDGKVDCSNDGIDEKYCWELELNECNDNEYRCKNGQCIPVSFYLDDINTPDCLDQSDEHRQEYYLNQKCDRGEPSVGCEDIICMNRPLTSSCLEKRTKLLTSALYSVKNASMPDQCWSTFQCLTRMPLIYDYTCNELCTNKSYLKLVEQMCPYMVFIPTVPVLFNDIYFAYTKNDSERLDCANFLFPYICYKNSNYDDYFIDSTKIMINNLACHRFENQSTSNFQTVIWLTDYVIPVYKALKKYTLTLTYTSNICNRTNMYQCIRSPKCISIYRIMDGINDCPYDDDEDIIQINNTYLIKQIKRTYFKCYISNKYIPQSSILDGKCDCGYIEDHWCEDEDVQITYARKNISFQTICDQSIELLPIMIDEQNYTDETECQLWPCNNIYTRCNGLWQCRNGEDEIGCYLSSLSSSTSCSSNEHLCVSPYTNQFTCLSINKTNDGNIDCLGGADEPNLCYDNREIEHNHNFYCVKNGTKLCLLGYQLCNGIKDCDDDNDEQFCDKNQSLRIGDSICYTYHSSIRSDIEQFLCETSKSKQKQQIVHFSLDGNQDSTEDQLQKIENTNLLPLLTIGKIQRKQFYCHRGLDLQLWLNKKTNSSQIICLCPPSYYGNQCQYQNQRVSLAIQFRASSNSWHIPFAVIISLIDDDERIIHSYEQFTYLSIRDCQVKFNIYLLYSTRPKEQTKSYSVHIDIYEKNSLHYRGSLLYPIRFPFLPVHRLAFIIDIPSDNDSTESCTDVECNHGKCIRYGNSLQNHTFCQCDHGWSGKYCNISYDCQCSSDSLCLGITNDNRSLCICPLHRFGPRCLLIDTVCQTNENATCENGGTCIPNDEYIESDQKYTCICPKGFIGKRCEINENKIILSFNKDTLLSQSIFIHFIQVMNNDLPRRATTFRTIPFRQDSVIIHWSQPFHIVFAEFPKHNYYLSILQHNYNRSTTINKTISISDRCPHINELFNESIVRLHLIRRIKYYQLPCQRKDLNLSCFYDDIHMCLCQEYRDERISNCFEFNHQMTFDCFGQSVCENDGKCFQDSQICPKRSMCICSSCYYGTKCQFSTSGLSLSLDAILGYHIQPHLQLIHQPSIVQISVVICLIFILIGLMNGIFALITFRNRTICEVGCGIYLLGSSITTLVTVIMFGLKFWILLLSQMELIKNRSFLLFQCHSIDFILRLGINMDQWLNGCVAVERAYTAIQGTQFNKRKSKRTAKVVIIILVLVVIGTNIQDPIYRRMINEENEDENRVWCIVSYPSYLQTFNTVMQTIHFCVPFLLNFISVITIIMKKTRQVLAVRNHRSYKEILYEQFRQHKHLVIAPLVLIILSIPRLIISFASKCMKSKDDSWLFVIGYFISFIPPMLTFVVFILPSKFYMKEFYTCVNQYRNDMQRRSVFIADRLLFRLPHRVHPTRIFITG